jgi:hypothetical protein
MTGVTTEKAPCRFDSTLKMNNPYWSTQFRRMHLPLVDCYSNYEGTSTRFGVSHCQVCIFRHA